MNRIFVAISLCLVGAWGQCPHEGDLPRWSDVGTWDSGRIPSEGESLTITKTILLDTETERIGGITLSEGGRLVFSPDEDRKVKLTARNILILNDGALEIGSDACRYTGEAEIMLWGNRSDDTNIGSFGQKFIGVDAGGSLEIHGPEKTSWTRLAKTLEPNAKAFFEEAQDESFPYFNLYEFQKSDGSLIQGVNEISSDEDMQNALDSVSSGSIVWIFKWGSYHKRDFAENMANMATILENYLGAEVASSQLRNLTKREDVYSLLIDTDDMSHLQSFDIWEGKNDPDGASPDELAMHTAGLTYKMSFLCRLKAKGLADTVRMEVLPEGWDEYTIELQDDISDWNAGDEIVIASTDYDYRQAERFTIKSVDGNLVSFTGIVENVHFSGEQEGVQMRAEVGMLSKNIRIYGEIQKQCYGVENMCESFEGDNFGGHTKALRGFKSYNIQGAEFYHMGQAAILGSYPIHYHMCHDTDEESNPIVKNNAIHDTFSRCVTIHGSHGVHVIDNVAVDHHGHCFFLEDGGERRTVLDHNLGMGTKKGILTQTDKKPTTFWITSPETVVTNNVAAGSDYDEGHGFWYIFPDEPVGPSTGLFFEPKQAQKTPIWECSGNVAHSNGNKGLAIFQRLGKQHNILGCSAYSPRVDPFERRSEIQPILIQDFTGYKNRAVHMRLRSAGTELVGMKLADAKAAVQFVRNNEGGYQRIRDSVIIGESINKGKPFPYVSYGSTKDGTYRNFYDFDRSIPYQTECDRPITGVFINAEGQSHVHNVKFFNFRHNECRWASAISWGDNYRFNNGITSSAKQLAFDWNDPDEGYHVYNPSGEIGRGDDTVALQDLDGSILGTPGTIMAPDTYVTDWEDCTHVDSWNLDVCQVNRFAEFFVSPKMERTWSSFVMDESLNIYAKAGGPRKKVSYMMREGQEMILNWNGTVPSNPSVKMTGMHHPNLDAFRGEEIILGICVPTEVSQWSEDLNRLISMDVPINEAESKEEFIENAEKNVFLDREKAIVYRKFTETRQRSETDLGPCIGSLRVDHCPFFTVILGRVDGVTLENTGDCRDRF